MRSLRELRERKKVSLRHVGQATGIFFTYLSEMERGIRKPTTEQLARLSDYYGVDPDSWIELLVTKDEE